MTAADVAVSTDPGGHRPPLQLEIRLYAQSPFDFSRLLVTIVPAIGCPYGLGLNLSARKPVASQ